MKKLAILLVAVLGAICVNAQTTTAKATPHNCASCTHQHKAKGLTCKEGKDVCTQTATHKCSGDKAAKAKNKNVCTKAKCSSCKPCQKAGNNCAEKGCKDCTVHCKHPKKK